MLMDEEINFLILDEPTSSLTANEVEALFRIIEDLKADGVSIVYISHKMAEIREIADDITIMRDGTYVGKRKKNTQMERKKQKKTR